MARLGYLGLGIMGYPMAANLRKAGHGLWVWSHDREKAERFAQREDAVACRSPREVAECTDCLFVSAGDTRMSQNLILGREGVAECESPGKVVVDTSTISALASEEMGKALKEKGMHLVDAPCTGSKLGAEGASLTFMVGGDAEVVDRIRPLLEAVGKQIFYCGPQGMGLRVKITQNLIQANMLEAFVEGIVLGTKAGIDPGVMLEILNNTAARSGLISFKAPYILRRDFSTHFSVKWMLKDIRLALDLAESLQVPVPITGVTAQMYQAAMAMGLAEEDFSSLIKVLESITGVEVRSP